MIDTGCPKKKNGKMKRKGEKKALPHSKKLKTCNKNTQKEIWDGKAKQKAKNP